MNLNTKTITSQFSEETLAKYRDPQFVEFAKQALSQVDLSGNLEEQDVNLIVDVFTIDELQGKEAAKQFFAEHALGLYNRDKTVLAALLGQLQKDEFFSAEEADALTQQVIFQSNAMANVGASLSNHAEKEPKAPTQAGQVTASVSEVATTAAQMATPIVEEGKTPKKDKVVKGVLASLLAVAMIAIAVMGYFLYDMSNQLSTSNANTTIKSNRVSGLEDEIAELENEVADLKNDKNELLHYKNAAKQYDEYAVIVVPAVDHYYHRINCSHLPDSYEYWTYNVDAAAQEGYTRCPDCLPANFDDYVQTHF